MASQIFSTESARWNAVRLRDPAADGVFVYCVKTTRIFCRPICKARLARRSNVLYCDTIAEAQLAGYRACKRCKPESERPVPGTYNAMAKVQIMLENLPQGSPLPTLEVLAAEAGLTKFHFHRSFKKATGMTPRRFALSRSRLLSPNIARSHASPCTKATKKSPLLIHDTILPPAAQIVDGLSDPEFSFDDWLISMPEDSFFSEDIHLNTESQRLASCAY